MTSILIGAPVKGRTWILPQWFDAVQEACEVADVEPAYMFALDTRNEETHACVVAHADMQDAPVTIKHVADSLNPEERNWGAVERIQHMTEIRNQLLDSVRRRHPRYFLSLDSDILINPNAIKSMIDNLGDYAAIGTKCFMGPGVQSPSYGYFTASNGLRRFDIDYVAKVGIIMAAKLMTPLAYTVDYAYNRNGEDIGWSLNCKAQGLKLGFDGTVTSKHVMKPEDLDKYDRRCGY